MRLIPHNEQDWLKAVLFVLTACMTVTPLSFLALWWFFDVNSHIAVKILMPICALSFCVLIGSGIQRLSAGSRMVPLLCFIFAGLAVLWILVLLFLYNFLPSQV
jgi:hypothetical protein